MLFSPKFQFWSYRTIWEYLLLLKQIIYLTMVVVAVLSGKILKKMESISASASASSLERQLSAEHERMVVRQRLNIVFGLVVLLISTRMVIL